MRRHRHGHHDMPTEFGAIGLIAVLLTIAIVLLALPDLGL